MAAFEISPTDFNKDAVERDFTPGNIADIKIKYKLPNDSVEKQFPSSVPLSYKDFNSIDRNFRFSTAVIMFGSLLRASSATKEINWNDTILLASQASDDNDPIQKEFVSLVKEAKILYTRQKKRKKLF
jgi:Ca-activated chloride channel family protein